MPNTIAKDTLCEYVRQNEVVFQALGDLIEVANEAERSSPFLLRRCIKR